MICRRSTQPTTRIFRVSLMRFYGFSPLIKQSNCSWMYIFYFKFNQIPKLTTSQVKMMKKHQMSRSKFCKIFVDEWKRERARERETRKKNENHLTSSFANSTLLSSHKIHFNSFTTIRANCYCHAFERESELSWKSEYETKRPTDGENEMNRKRTLTMIRDTEMTVCHINWINLDWNYSFYSSRINLSKSRVSRWNFVFFSNFFSCWLLLFVFRFIEFYQRIHQSQFFCDVIAICSANEFIFHYNFRFSLLEWCRMWHKIDWPFFFSCLLDNNSHFHFRLLCCNQRFQYVLAAATSIATKSNEETITYLNQGQSYEIKLKKLGDLSAYRGKLLRVRNFVFIVVHWVAKN